MSKDVRKGAKDDGLGCQAFGHLTSPYVDGEVPGEELPAFETHLPSCAPCSNLVEEYRAIDQLAQRDIPRVATAEWAQVWTKVEETIRKDAQEASEAPLADVLSFMRRLAPSRSLRPLLYVAASLLVAFGLMTIQDRDATPEGNSPAVIVEASTPAETMKVASVVCEAPGYMPMHYKIAGELDAEPVTIIQCAWVGTDA